MRLLLEIILAAALIALAWEKSLQERASDLPWVSGKKSPMVKTPTGPQPSQPPVAPPSVVYPTPTVSGAWMWDSNRRAPLDPPSKKRPSSTPH